MGSDESGKPPEESPKHAPSEIECETCRSEEGHPDSECIEVDGKMFCPNTLMRVYTEEEKEEMPEEEINAPEEKLELVTPAVPAVYRIVRV